MFNRSLVRIVFISLFLISLTACSEASSNKPTIKELTVQDVTPQYLSEHLLIDVREPVEFAEGYIENASLIPLGTLQSRIPDLLKTKFPNKTSEELSATPILLYCRSGNRSGVAADIMQKMGYSNVASLKGGIKAWKKSGRKIEK